MNRTLTIAAAALACMAMPVAAQTVTIQAPTTVDPLGRPVGIGKTFIYRADGSIVDPSSVTAAASIATGQISTGTTATLIVATRAARKRVILTVGAANSCAFGPAGVTLTTGFPLQPAAGATLTVDSAAALYAVCSATTTISYMEHF